MKLVFYGIFQYLVGYTNPDLIVGISIRHWTLGYIFKIGDWAIFWSLKRQYSVSLLFFEAEYVAKTSVNTEAIWLKSVFALFVIEIDLLQAKMIYKDNQRAIALVKNPKFYS